MKSQLVPLLVRALGAGLILAFAVGDAPASAFQRQARQCFRAAEVNGFTARNDREVDIRVGARRHYRLSLYGSCPADFSLRVGIRTRGGSSWICEGADAELLVRGPTGPERCLVRDIRLLTPDEVSARNRRR